MTDVAQVKSSKTVTVGCKLPNGHILQLWHMHDEVEIGPGGTSRVAKIARPLGEPVRLNGCATPVGGPHPKHMIIGGYGLTPNVDADFFAKWLEQNKLSQLVKNNLIFSASSRDAAERQAEEQESVKSGLEPLDPSFTTAKDGRIIPNDPRYPRSVNPSVSSPHTAERAA